MILDTIENSDRYIGLHKNFAKAFEYIKSQNLHTLEPGKYVIDGTELFSAVSLKEGVITADAKFEAHQNYIDIQYCVSGVEKIGWSPKNTCSQPKAEYNAEKDVTFYNDEPVTYFQLIPEQFVIFFPEDVHAPMIGEGLIKKLVLKIKL